MSGKTGDCCQKSLTYNLTTCDTFSTNFNTWYSCGRLLPKFLIIIINNLQLLYCNYMLEKQQPCVKLESGLQSTSGVPGMSQPCLSSQCCVLGHLPLTMPHSSNNITFGGSGGTHTCKNKTLVFSCEDHFHFHRFCLFYFFKRFFPVRYRRNLAILLKIRATFRPDSVEVTANRNTLDVFQYKTNNNKDGRSYTCVNNHSHVPQSFTNIAGS